MVIEIDHDSAVEGKLRAELANSPPRFFFPGEEPVGVFRTCPSCETALYCSKACMILDKWYHEQSCPRTVRRRYPRRRVLCSTIPSDPNDESDEYCHMIE